MVAAVGPAVPPVIRPAASVLMAAPVVPAATAAVPVVSGLPVSAGMVARAVSAVVRQVSETGVLVVPAAKVARAWMGSRDRTWCWAIMTALMVVPVVTAVLEVSQSGASVELVGLPALAVSAAQVLTAPSVIWMVARVVPGVPRAQWAREVPVSRLVTTARPPRAVMAAMVAPARRGRRRLACLAPSMSGTARTG